MKSQLLVILGISSTLLGLYILVVSLLNIEERADYHIGCYLSNHTNDNSFHFRTRLQQLKSRGDDNRIFYKRLRNSQLIDSHLNKKSVQLTKNVDTYIQKLALTKKYQQNNMNFFAQLSGARQDYQDCARQIQSIIDTDNSKSLWDQYKKCFDKYQGIKDSVQSLYFKRNTYLEEIDRLLVFDPIANRTFDLEAELRKIKEKYDRQNAENDKNKEIYISQLKRFQHKNQTKSTEHDQNERQYNRAHLQYEICLKNLKQFRKCEDIANALRQYGYVESMESLQERIRSKRQHLMKLQELVMQSRQGAGDNKIITQMYAKRQKQLIQTIKLRLYMGYDEMKECGCTEEHRQKLQKDFQDAKMKLNINKKEINDLIYEIYTLEKKIKQADRQRQKLINQFREETQRLRNRETSNFSSLQQLLDILKVNLNLVNNQIGQHSPKLNSLEFECNQYKDRLSHKLKDSQTVTNCLGKKSFYDQLKSKAQQILKRDDVSSLGSKQKVKQSLQEIIYPDNIDVKQIILSQQVIQSHKSIQKLEEMPSQKISHRDQQTHQHQEEKVNQQKVIIIEHTEKIIIETKEL